MTTTDTTTGLFVNGEHVAADQFAWDGCHKIYLIPTTDARDEFIREYGWELEDMHPIAELPQAWEDSCSLRFISWADLSVPNLVNQFDENVTVEYVAADGTRRVAVDLRPERTSIWVAADGSWGDGEIDIIDTTLWTGEDFDAVEQASDDERLDVARALRDKKEGL